MERDTENEDGAVFPATWALMLFSKEDEQHLWPPSDKSQEGSSWSGAIMDWLPKQKTPALNQTPPSRYQSPKPIHKCQETIINDRLAVYKRFTGH